jgi:hypothetical protein
MTYVEMCRSNYFVVKDEGEFHKFCERFNVTPFESDSLVGEAKPMLRAPRRRTRKARVVNGFYREDGGIPTSDNDAEGTDGDIFAEDFMKELSKQLTEGQVAIVEEIGYEGMRALHGVAFAVNWRGTLKWVGLSQITKIAQQMAGAGVKVAEACS